MGTVIDIDRLLQLRARWKETGLIMVFTNGVFDLLHRGHCEYLAAARAEGDILVVGLNSDASVRRIKGDKKPIVPEAEFATLRPAETPLFWRYTVRRER